MKRGIIIGAGIGGLTTALALLKKGIDFEIYEQANDLAEVGAGIWIAPNGLKVLKKLGIEWGIIRGGRFIDKIFVIDTNNKIIAKIDSDRLSRKHGFKTLAIHRAALQHALASAIPEGKINFNRKFASFDQTNDYVQANFADGTTRKADFLIVADGIGSVAKNQIDPDTKLRYSGQTCWRFITEFELPGLDNMYEVWANERGLRVGYMRINRKQVFVFITNFQKAGEKDDRTMLKARLLELCQDFQPLILDLIGSVNENNIIRTDLFDHEPAKKWVDNRVALLGDAAHASTPNLGQGASQAIEDAYRIAEELAKDVSLQESLENYAKMRIQKAHYITKLSWLMASISNKTGVKKNLYKGFMRATPGFILNRRLDKIYSI